MYPKFHWTLPAQQTQLVWYVVNKVDHGEEPDISLSEKELQESKCLDWL